MLRIAALSTRTSPTSSRCRLDRSTKQASEGSDEDRRSAEENRNVSAPSDCSRAEIAATDAKRGATLAAAFGSKLAVEMRAARTRIPV